MIIVYTGNGKGKTSACLGQVLRALGRGLSVAFAQFFKRKGEAGEQLMLEKLLGENFLAGGLGFFTKEEDRPAHSEAARATLAWAQARLSLVDVLILDESIYALRAGLLSREDLRSLMAKCRGQEKHLVLSGRDFPEDMLDEADTVTSMTEVRHPWQKGQAAVPGVDY